MEKRNESRSCDLNISWGTIFKVFAACLVAVAAIRLSEFFQILGLSILLAVALRPILLWALRRRWPKWSAVALCGLILFGTTALLLGIIVPAVGSEGSQFVKDLPTYKTNLLDHLPQSGPVRNIANEMLASPSFSHPELLIKKAVSWSGSGLKILAGFLAVLVLAVYFLADGAGVYEWITAFLPKSKRLQMNHAKEEIAGVVSHYVGGSALTSSICGVYAFTVLSILHVPSAILLAVIAAVFDVLPLIGFFIFTFPAVLVALTVSPRAAILVFLLFGAYHLTEAYFIVPKIYGHRLKLSGLTVLVCCLSAGIVSGVISILLVLPLAACYPLVERIWLKPYLDRETVQKHREIAARTHAPANHN